MTSHPKPPENLQSPINTLNKEIEDESISFTGRKRNRHRRVQL